MTMTNDKINLISIVWDICKEKTREIKELFSTGESCKNIKKIKIIASLLILLLISFPIISTIILLFVDKLNTTNAISLNISLASFMLYISSKIPTIISKVIDTTSRLTNNKDKQFLIETIYVFLVSLLSTLCSLFSMLSIVLIIIISPTKILPNNLAERLPASLPDNILFLISLTCSLIWILRAIYHIVSGINFQDNILEGFGRGTNLNESRNNITYRGIQL